MVYPNIHDHLLVLIIENVLKLLLYYDQIWKCIMIKFGNLNCPFFIKYSILNEISNDFEFIY